MITGSKQRQHSQRKRVPSIIKKEIQRSTPNKEHKEELGQDDALKIHLKESAREIRTEQPD